jgi:hypothetical protein|tara:strand:- start:584 stop:745 length:162 start_codon:yes stop_codon:yes gene_type:complete
MKIIVLFGSILFIFLLFKILSERNKINKSSKKQNETTIDLEKDPKTKEYKPKE